MLEEQFEQNAAELSQQQLDKPLFIIGLPRTGSTLLHNRTHSSVIFNNIIGAKTTILSIFPPWALLVLFEDEELRCCKLWELRRPLNTVELPNEESRIEAEKRHWDQFFSLYPHFASIHHVRAEGPGECISLLDYEMFNGAQIFIGRSKEYADWYLSVDKKRAVEIYSFHKKFMQLLQLKDSMNNKALANGKVTMIL